MTNFKNHPTRRQFLRGVCRGVPLYLAMPTLVSLLPREARAATSPMNLFFMFLPNGTFPHTIVNQKVKLDDTMSTWFPTVGALPANLPTMLKKLEGNIADFSVISGLRSPISDGNVSGGPHIAATRMLTASTFSAGAGYSSADAMQAAGYSPSDSIDQIIGKKLAGSGDIEAIQKQVLFARMQTAPGGGGKDTPKWSNKLCFYNHQAAFSYSSPKNMFESVFGGTIVLPPNEKQGRINALDYLLNDVKDKKNKASAEDKQILERWLAGYEDIKSKINDLSASSAVAAAGNCPGSLSVTDSSLDSSNETAEDYDKICDLFLKIFLSSMECGARRVCTMLMHSETRAAGTFDKALLASDLHAEQGRTVSLADMAVDPHQGMAHYGEGGADMLDYLRLVSLNNYFMRKYKFVIDEMKTRNIFDNSLAVTAYCTRDGMHNSGDGDFPFLMAGKGGGFKTGKHHRLVTEGPAFFNNKKAATIKKMVPVDNIWTTVLAQYGITYDSPHATGNASQLFG